jgi:signal recognition particle receptor subunit beta
MSGKTFTVTMAKVMKNLEDPSSVFDFVTVADQATKRTVFFDQAVFGFGRKPDSDEFLFKIHVFTTAGEKRLKETRKVVLQGIHGLVLVIDADLENWDENVWSLRELKELKSEDIIKEGIPYTFFVNKQDLTWGTRITENHVKHLLDAADVADLFPNVEGNTFSGSCLQARKDLSDILRTIPRDIILNEEGNFKREFRPKSFEPIMKSLEDITKQVIKKELREKTNNN